MRTALTNFFARFITDGIGDAKKQPRYSDDIQLVHSVAPSALVEQVPYGWNLPIPAAGQVVYELYATSSGGSGQQTVELEAGGRGLWLLTAGIGSSGVVDFKVWTLSAPRGLATTILPTQLNTSAFGGTTAAAPDSLAQFHHAKHTFDSLTNSRSYRTSNPATGASWGMSLWYDPPIFIPAGQVVTIQRTDGVAAAFMGFRWRDIPL